MATGDLATLTAVRAYLAGQVPVPQQDDALLEGLITAVSLLFLKEAERNVITAEYVDTFHGNDGTRVYLQNYPVAEVTAVYVDGEAVSQRAAVGEAGWVLTDAATGRLELVGGYTWAAGIANCSVTYTAGHGASAPADVAQAVVDQVAYLYRQKDRIGISNQSVGGESVTYLGAWSAQQGKDGHTPLFAAAIERYRRIG